MTPEELQELKPSFENPVRFKRKKELKDVTFEYLDVTHMYEGRVVVIMVENNSIDVVTDGWLLDNYELDSLKSKYEVLYECLGDTGISSFNFEDGHFPLFKYKEKTTCHDIGAISRKTGRKLLLNMETWEVCEYDEGLL